MLSLSADLLLVFPAFLLGSAFGALVALVANPPQSAKSVWPWVRFSMAGSAAGALLFVLTTALWPPILGPFVACPAAALIAILVRNLILNLSNRGKS